jgi:hypothetical protein
VSVLPRLCRTCGGGSPLDDNPCTCGSKWAPEPDDGPPDWEMLFHQLLVRSGRRCEARTPWCFGMPRDGYIGHLVRQQTSIQHRRPRRSGGSRRPDTHSLANLMVLCGTGNTGCHGYIETKERAVALRRGGTVGTRRVATPQRLAATSPRRYSGRVSVTVTAAGCQSHRLPPKGAGGARVELPHQHPAPRRSDPPEEGTP